MGSLRRTELPPSPVGLYVHRVVRGHVLPGRDSRFCYIAGGWWGSISVESAFLGSTAFALAAPDGFTESRSSLEGLKKGTRLAGTSTFAPVLGLRPVRALRCRVRKLPKPRISILSPDFRAPMTASKSVSTMTSPSRRVRSPMAVTWSTRSALVIVWVPFVLGRAVGAAPRSVLVVDYRRDEGS